MIGDRCICIAASQAGIGNLAHRGRTVAPLGVHLQVATIVVPRWPVAGPVAEYPQCLGAAEYVLPQPPSSRDVGLPVTLLDGVLDRR